MSTRRTLPFVKMHGAGNDYVFVDCFRHRVSNPARLARLISDRHFGVGGDGLILILPCRNADLRMRIFNADGSEAEMCGNGIRCVAKYAYDHGLTHKRVMTIATGAGIKTIRIVTARGKVVRATVDMGVPALRRRDIPMTGDPESNAIAVALPVGNDKYEVTCVAMGNPHCVIFIKDDPSEFPLEWIGPQIECHPAFPKRTNVHIVQRLSESEVRMRTWERGSGITLACGTGASAVCVAGALTGRTGRSILAHLPGGDLRIEWRADGHVFMTGPAVESFTGLWPLRR